jgi:tetratricopeptide (TPR) repeat protein
MLAGLVLFVVIAVVYVQALGGPFVWDDRLLILDAPLVDKAGPLAEYLRQPFWMGVGGQPRSVSYYRPLVTLSLAFDRRLHGNNPGGFHLTNLLFHELNALLFYAVLRKFGVRTGTALFLSAAWALQPRLAEAAAWISGRTDLFATTGVFAAILCWGPRSTSRVIAALALALGLLAKESALAGLVAIATWEWLGADAAKASERLRVVARRVWPALALTGAVLVLRVHEVGVKSEGEALGILGRARTVLQAVGTYVTMLADPFRPRAAIGRIGAYDDKLTALGLATVVFATFAYVRYRSRLPATSKVGIALALASLFPVLHVVPIPLRTLAADRFLYLPTAGLALALAPLLEHWVGQKRWTPMLGALAVALLGWGTASRVAVWSDEVEFWIETYLETPHTNSAPLTELVGVFYRAGRFGDALELSRRAEAYDDPGKALWYGNAALCLTRLGRIAEALELLQAHPPRRQRKDVRIQMAVLELELGRSDAAKEFLQPLAEHGNAEAKRLLGWLPQLEFAQAELARGDALEPEERARLASFMSNDALAIPAWRRVFGDANAAKATLHAGLVYLVQTGDRELIAHAAEVYRARFGEPDSALDEMVRVKLFELDRLLAERHRLSLSSP